jgi:hypothetical protein
MPACRSQHKKDTLPFIIQPEIVSPKPSHMYAAKALLEKAAGYLGMGALNLIT